MRPLNFFLPVAYISRNTWNGGGGRERERGEGGGGGGLVRKDTSTNFSQEWIFRLIVYCLETPKFVVSTNWL